MSQLAFCICRNPEEVDPNVSEVMNILARRGQAGKEQMLPSFMSLYRFPAEGMAHTKGMSFHLKTGIKSVCLPAFRSRSKVHLPPPQKSELEVDSPTLNEAENLSQVCSPYLDYSPFQI